MEYRDLVMDQIEQLGQVLGRILAGFLGLKSKGHVTQGIEIANDQLSDKLDVEVSHLLKLDREALNKYIQERKLRPDHYETLSRYLREVGESKILSHRDREEGAAYLIKSIELLGLADEVSQTFSFDRMNQIAEIKKVLHERSVPPVQWPLYSP